MVATDALVDIRQSKQNSKSQSSKLKDKTKSKKDKKKDERKGKEKRGARRKEPRARINMKTSGVLIAIRKSKLDYSVLRANIPFDLGYSLGAIRESHYQFWFIWLLIQFWFFFFLFNTLAL